MAGTSEMVRLQLRRGWRALVPVAVIVAVVAAIVLWSTAGARRTNSAFDRMLVENEAWQLQVNPQAGDTALTTEALAAVPGVTDVSRLEVIIAMEESIDDWASFSASDLAATSDGGSGYRMARPLMVGGRMPAVDSTDEIYLDEGAARTLGVGVGDTLSMRFPSPEEAGALFAVEGDDDALQALLAQPGFAEPRPMTVTGIGRPPESFSIDGGFDLDLMVVPPAMTEVGVTPFGFGVWQVRLADVARTNEVRAAIEALVPDEPIAFQTIANVTSKAQRGMRPPAVALAIFAVVGLLLGMLFVGQAVSRWLAGRRQLNDVSRALGSPRGDRWRSSLGSLGVAIGTGVVAGAAVAVVASPLTPVGPARKAEIDPGLHVDGPVLAVGSAVLFVVLLIASAVPTWWAARADAGRRGRLHASRVAAGLAAAGAPIPVTTGARFALERSEGRSSAMPSIVGAFTALLVATAALVVSASIGDVIASPRLYGSPWTMLINFDGEDEPWVAADDVATALTAIDVVLDQTRAIGGVTAASAVLITEVTVNSTRLPALSFTGVDDGVEPTIAEGRAPRSVDEVALGRSTMRALRAGIDDRVTVIDGTGQHEATVVGRVVLPAAGAFPTSDKTSLGDGVLVVPEAVSMRGVQVALVAVTEPELSVAAMEAALSDIGAAFGARAFVEEAEAPSEVRNLEALHSIPVFLAIALAVLVGIPVVHSLFSSVRARRRDLAVMSVLGARPRMLRSVGVWQGLTVVAIAVLAGVPMGIVVGRAGWTVMANSFGTVAEPAVPAVPIVLLVVATLCVGAVLGGAPVWRSNRRSTVVALRPE